MELSLGEEADRGNGGACEVGVGVDAFRYGSGCGHECRERERRSTKFYALNEV